MANKTIYAVKIYHLVRFSLVEGASAPTTRCL